MQLRVIAVFAGVGFLLAAIGIHGVLSYSVAQRMQEIGVRIALGAHPGNILRMVVGRAALLAICGLVPGIALAYAAARSMQALLVSIAPGDAATLAAATTLVFVMTMAGSLIPARRALRVDPLSVIRSE